MDLVGGEVNGVNPQNSQITILVIIVQIQFQQHFVCAILNVSTHAEPSVSTKSYASTNHVLYHRAPGRFTSSHSPSPRFEGHISWESLFPGSNSLVSASSNSNSNGPSSSFENFTAKPTSGVRRKKFRGGGFKVMAGLVGGLGAEPPGRRRIFENLQRNSRRKLQKCCIFAYFAKKFQNHALNFRAFGRKTQLFGEIFDKNSMKKLNFYLFLGKFVAKIETSEMTSFFYNNFFRFGGGVQPPLGTPLNPSFEKEKVLIG